MSKFKTRWIVVPIVIVLTMAITACGGNNVNAAAQRESRAQNQDSFNLVNNQPIPVFTHSQIRQELIDIETAQANGVQSTTFFMNMGDPHPEGSCSSIGAPVASDTELSNPQMQVRDPNNGSVPGSNVLAQMDPNGVYSGPSSGTYVMCVDPSTGRTYAQYWEGFVRVVFGPAIWDNATNSPKLVGNATTLFNDIKSSQ